MAVSPLCILPYSVRACHPNGAAGPKKLVKGPVVDENALKADDIRNRGIFSF
jgi:hypothetical protein